MRTIVFLFCLVAFASSATAQSVDELKAQLAAQKRINELLKQRIRTLEAQANPSKSDRVAALAPQIKAIEAPEPELESPDENRALERALVRRGRAVLPAYKFEISPSFSWTHSTNRISKSDNYAASLDARVGLPGEWMVGARVPFSHRSIDPIGENTGFGDPSIAVWKGLMAQDGTWPSLVASIRYTAPMGDDFTQANIPLGSGYHRVTSRLSAVKSMAPIAFYGNASYTHTFDRTVNGIKREPGGIFGLGAGATLAVSPDVSLSAGLNFSFADHTKFNGIDVAGSDRTVGVVSLGAGVILTKDLFLNFSSAFGVTDNSPDATLSVSLPYRF